MTDLIDRQAAINAIQGIERLATLPDNDAVIRMSAIEYILFNLPSAQPEIIHCRDCEKYGTKFCALDIWTEQAIIRRATPDDFCSKRAERRTDGDK